MSKWKSSTTRRAYVSVSARRRIAASGMDAEPVRLVRPPHERRDARIVYSESTDQLFVDAPHNAVFIARLHDEIARRDLLWLRISKCWCVRGDQLVALDHLMVECFGSVYVRPVKLLRAARPGSGGEVSPGVVEASPSCPVCGGEVDSADEELSVRWRAGWYHRVCARGTRG